MRKYINIIPKKKCKYCKNRENLTIDHKIPKIIGGKDEKKNLQCLCMRCNTMKSGMSDRQVRSIWNWFLKIQRDRIKNGAKPYELRDEENKIKETI